MAGRIGQGILGFHNSAYDEPDIEPVPKLADFTLNDWMKKLGQAEVYESDLQHLVLNFLTINGLAAPAEEFTREAHVDAQMPLHAISCRHKIREAILAGRTEEAIQEISSIDPCILNADPEVSFLVQKQQLLRLIAEGDAGVAISFAQQHLAPCVKECPHLLPQLEEAMALLAFNDLSCPEAQKLMGGLEQREETARRIDEAILDLYRIEQESALELLVKNVLFSERIIQSNQLNLIPLLTDLRRGTLGRGPQPSQRRDSGADSSMGCLVGGEEMAVQVDSEAMQQQQEGSSSSRPRQQTTAAAAGTAAPRRTRSRDFMRRRRPGDSPA